MTLALTTLFALLALVAVVGAVALVVSAPFRAWMRPHAVGATAAISGTATVGSLYLSEIAGYVPCELCWWQRIFMYSTAVISTTALLRRRTDALAYTLPLALFGVVTSIWHVIIQRLPADTSAQFCDPNNPCSAIWVERFGFITIPTMAGAGFIAIIALAWAARSSATAGSGREATKEELVR
ncbi:disulfide bond formation protein B [Euzebya sp.]|uniref:disulfide bond formation protein B n=1 Tax=Euzebya sp. TaxID=1971409 RepID=UPI003512895B